MHALLDEYRHAIETLCARYGVVRLDVFGSAASADGVGPPRDFDFLVRFSPSSPLEHYDRYFGLAESLEDLLGQPVDLVEDGAIRNPYFQAEVERSRLKLYAA